jgi:hypothetical protein
VTSYHPKAVFALLTLRLRAALGKSLQKKCEIKKEENNGKKGKFSLRG